MPTRMASQSIVARLLAVAEHHPDNIAVRWHNHHGWNELNYTDLVAKARSVAAILTAAGVKAGSPVVLPAERHPDLCANLIGILLCGAHYVFIDPNHPAERQRLIAEAVSAEVGIDAPGSAALKHLNIAWLNTGTAHDVPDGDLAPEISGNGELPAYVMFTSGSTGEPKGVVVPHRAILRLVTDTDYISFTADQAFLQLSALSFDASTLELWGPLLNGGTCVLHPETNVLTPNRIRDVIVSQQITTLWLTSSLFNAFVADHVDYLKPVQQLLTGGEALSVSHVKKALQHLPETALFNGYGPTENTTFTTVFPIPQSLPDALTRIPIGYPIHGTQCALVDADLNLIEGPNKAGELVTWGEGLALGYLHKPELTEEKFIQLRTRDGNVQTAYRTGDLVQRKDDGSYDYLARIDQQVKIDGLRIEPGEIEHQLNRMTSVAEARVVVRTGPQGQKRMAAYLVSDSAIEPRSVRKALGEVFPAYMVPHFIIQVGELPKNKNGKLDEARLPDPYQAATHTAAETAPGNLKDRVIACWSTVLNRPVDGSLATDVNFMDAGGTSLEALQLATLFEQAFKVELNATFVFEHPTVLQQAAFLASQSVAHEATTADHSTDRDTADRQSSDKTEFAIIGMACRFPGANNLDEYWQNLLDGKETVSFFSDEELSPEVTPEERTDRAYVRAKGIIEGYDRFDAKFFGVSPLEARVMDPQQRIMLELCWHALEDAAIPPGDETYRTGVFAGMNWARYYQQYVLPDQALLDSYGALNCALANEPDTLSTRISYKLNLKGPSINVFTACSTGLVAVAQACEAIANGQCEQALAAGVSVSTPVKRGYRYQEGSMLSRDGHCRPFDQEATGTTFNDGAGVIVLKRRDLAERDGDNVYAVIKGYAVNNDGEQKASFTAPSVAGQVAVYQDALKRAAIDPSTVGCIETHGTATPLGDPIEVLSLKRCYAADGNHDKTCAIGSVKSNIGHAIHAAGIASLIKSTLAVRENRIPPTLFFQTANPKLELEQSPFYVNSSVAAWKLPSPRRAAVTSLGVGGTNAHVILEEYVPRDAAAQRSDTNTEIRFPLLISAKSDTALEHQIARYGEFFSNKKGGALADVSHTSIHGRKHFEHRAIVFGTDLPQIVDNLGKRESFATGKADPNASQAIGFMFSGQGTQVRDMGRWLYDHSAAYRATFDEGCDIVYKTSGVDVRGILFAEGQQTADDRRIDQTSFVQPALFLLEYGLANYLIERGVRPSNLIGHSIGEFAAAALSGVFSFADTARLVATRGALMQSRPAGKMLIVQANPDAIAHLVGHRAEVAAVNAPNLMVLSGETESIMAVASELSKQKIASTLLPTSHAFHSSMMEPIVPEFAQCVAEIQRNPPTIPIYSTLTGALLSDEEATSPRYWAQQLRNPVQFSKALQALGLRNERNGGQISLVEVGPGNTLVSLTGRHQDLAGIQALPALLHKGADEQAAGDLDRCVGQLWVNGHALDWQRGILGGSVRKERLPGYAFARDRHWLGPVEDSGQADRPAVVHSATAAQSVDSGLTAHSNPLAKDAKMDATQHYAKIRADVTEIIEDVSGYELGGADPGSHFSEVGLDSLLLTQIATALEREFKLGITFRHLVEEYTSLELISDYIASQVELPVLTEAVPSQAVSTAQAPVTQPGTGPQAVPAGIDFGVGAAASGGSDLHSIVNAQLQIMQLQLQALGGQSGQQSAPNQQASTATTEKAPAVTANQSHPGSGDSKPEAPVKATHTPGTRIAREQTNTKLTSAQQGWVDRLMTNYQKRYAGSKEYTQQHRKHLADPRSVSGFNPGWKEIIFPIVTVQSKGSKLWDIDGNELIDTANGFGPILFGHSPEFIANAAKAQIDRGVETGPQSSLAGEVADLFCELTGNERCAFACTGSEANVGALRIARTVTGRTKVVAFEGAYHGIHDEVVMRAGKDHKALPAAPGIPREATANMLLLPWGEQSSLDEIRKLGDELAAVLVEPVQSRKPQFHSQEYLSEIRKITEENGVAMILDEVVTGFRVGPGGIRKRFNIDADIMTYGKVVGGGYPIGVIAGKAKYLDALDGGHWQYGDDSIPEQGVTFFAGTFVRHPLSLAIAKAVLTRIKDDGDTLYPALEQKTSALAQEAKSFITTLKSNVSFEAFASLFYVSVPASCHWGHLLFLSMTLDGIHIQQYRPNFLTTEHSDEDVRKILQAFKSALANLVLHGLFEGDQVAAKKFLSGNTSIPSGAKLGKNEHGEPAYFIEDPDQKGSYVEVGRP